MRRRSAIAHRLIRRLALAVALLAVAATAVQTWLEYRIDLEELDVQLGRIESVWLDSIVETTWLEDGERLSLLVAGIGRIPNIAAVEVRTSSGAMLAETHSATAEHPLVRSWPLVRMYRNNALEIGELTVVASIDGIRAHAAQRIWMALAANAVLIAMISLVLYAMVDGLVTGRLRTLAARARTLGREGLLVEDAAGPAVSGDDELGDLGRAFHEMHRELAGSYAALQDSEARLRELFTSSPVSLWDESFTEVKQELDRLRRTDTNLQAHLDADPELVRRLAEMVRVRDVNEASVALHRAASREDLLGNLPRTFTPGSLQAFRQEIDAIWHGRTQVVMESEVKTLDGEPRQVILHWLVPPGHEATLDRVLVSLLDITERKDAEQALAITVEKLMQANSELERFTHVAAHDLQEPVRNVVSFGQLLERRLGSGLDAEAAEYLGYLKAAARRMQEQVAGLVAYSRTGHAPLIHAPVDLNEVAAAAASGLDLVVAEAGGRIDLGELPTVRGDAAQLGQVFAHLLSNAVKFRREGTAPVVSVSATREGAEWLITVADNGIGIDPRFHDAVFQVFARLHIPGRFPGAGLGLATCRRIIERHGGRIWLESEPGHGTTLRFVLPA
jgi:signal transduction histidine kinase